MNKSFKILTVFVFCLNSMNMVAQHKEKQIELLHLNIKEESLSTILDDIILHEKKCSYYDCGLLFSISIKKSEDNFLISIESQKDINVLLPLSSYGYLYHQNHLFILQGERCENIFSTCGETRAFKYLDYNHPDFQPKEEDKKTIYVFNDDSFSQWHYWYVNAKFVLEEKSTSCD
ncbi:hypothetical protein [Schleiferia thermophila]|uniref:hypothetical protein n=1 Tax=Schleiferia thermophila TaxID=884107 RepID=UPI000CABDF71|nr:hypothetical protein [Schleiferia thermophila]PMB24972.1 hypothetical protein CEN47_17380 [Fischerella thermalis CCMEE 5319]